MQFGINKYLLNFLRPQIALALRAHGTLLVFEKFTRAYLFQIGLETNRAHARGMGQEPKEDLLLFRKLKENAIELKK